MYLFQQQRHVQAPQVMHKAQPKTWIITKSTHAESWWLRLQQHHMFVFDESQCSVILAANSAFLGCSPACTYSIHYILTHLARLQTSTHQSLATKANTSMPLHQLAARRWSTSMRAGIAAFSTATVMATVTYALGFRSGGIRGGE